MNYHPHYTITDTIRVRLQEIERLKDSVQNSRILPAVEASVHSRATVEAIHSSTSIEGNPLSQGEVRHVIAADQPLTKEAYAELEVQNYKHALDYIAQRRHDHRDIGPDDALALHGVIMAGLTTKNRTGKWRFTPVYIENQATHEVVYTGAPEDAVESETKELFAWLKNNRFSIHPIILAGILHAHFVAIHPFADGNGRTTRALTALYLALNQYDVNGSLVLDSYYASDRQAYYQALRAVQGGNYATSLERDLTSWLEYFVEGYLTSLRVLDAEIRMLNIAVLQDGHARDGQPKLSRDDEDLLSYAVKFGEISISEAEAILPELNRRALQRRLKQLVDAGYLELVGATHEARYVLKV